MNENLKVALQKICGDAELLAKFENFTSPEEAYAFACSVQDGYTMEEFMSTMKKLKASRDASNELTDEDLAKTAGGISDAEDIALMVSLSISCAGLWL